MIFLSSLFGIPSSDFFILTDLYDIPVVVKHCGSVYWHFLTLPSQESTEFSIEIEYLVFL